MKNPNLCGYPACEHSRKFNYLLDTNYVYKYSVDVATLFRGTSENRSTLYVEALVNLKFIAPCQGVLQVCQCVRCKIEITTFFNEIFDTTLEYIKVQT